MGLITVVALEGRLVLSLRSESGAVASRVVVVPVEVLFRSVVDVDSTTVNLSDTSSLAPIALLLVTAEISRGEKRLVDVGETEVVDDAVVDVAIVGKEGKAK